MGEIVKADAAIAVLTKALEQRKGKIRTLLAGSIPDDHFIQVAITAAFKNPDILKCEQTSVIASVYQAASLGLSLDPALKECYMVPYWNKKAGKYFCQPIIGYKGLEALCIRSGLTLDIRSRVVYEKDSFGWEEGTDPVLHHRPYMGEDRGDIKAVYAVATLEGGRTRFRVLLADEVLKQHKSRSRGASSEYTPWSTDLAAMFQKTAVRVLASELPRSRYNGMVDKALTMEDDPEGAEVDILDEVPAEEPKALPAQGEIPVDDPMSLVAEGIKK